MAKVRVSENVLDSDLKLNVQIEIQNGRKGFFPEVVDSVTWTTERKDTPGKLIFSVLWDDKLDIEEGCPVKLTVKNETVFYGFIFTFNHTKSNVVQITAYDQIRYLLNKDTYTFKRSTARGIVEMIAKDYGINTGELEETEYVIPARVMDNKTLLDMIQDSLEMTLTNTKVLFCLYDDAGALTLSDVARMKVGLMIDAESAEDFNYNSTIDSGVYNVVKLAYKKDDEIKQIYVKKDEKNLKKWGTLQYFEEVTDNSNANNKASTLLSLYNTKNKSLTINKVIGDLRVRAGCLLLVRLKLHDMDISNWMLVETCTHTFENNRHTMNLKLRGGEFVG